MIEATIYRRNDGTRTGFVISGHAGYDVKGKDIVCAAVSSLAIATVNALEEHEDTMLLIGDDYISCKIAEPSLLASVMIEVLEKGLCGITEEYGEYVTLHLLGE